MDSSLEPVTLDVQTTDRELMAICHGYWKINPIEKIPYYAFAFRVKDIATYCQVRDTKTIVNRIASICTAYVHCIHCLKRLTLIYRSHYTALWDYQAMQRDPTLRGPLCQDCLKVLANPQRMIKNLFFDKMEYLHFIALQKFYPIVYPKIGLSSLLRMEAVKHMFGRALYFNQTYFMEAKVSFVLYEKETYCPITVVDYENPSTGRENLKIAFKRAAFAEVGLPYYYLPKEENQFYTEPQIILLGELFNDMFSHKQK